MYTIIKLSSLQYSSTIYLTRREPDKRLVVSAQVIDDEIFPNL